MSQNGMLNKGISTTICAAMKSLTLKDLAGVGALSCAPESSAAISAISLCTCIDPSCRCTVATWLSYHSKCASPSASTGKTGRHVTLTYISRRQVARAFITESERMSDVRGEKKQRLGKRVTGAGLICTCQYALLFGERGYENILREERIKRNLIYEKMQVSVCGFLVLFY